MVVYYLYYEISEYTLELTVAHMLGININNILLPYIEVFTKTLGLSYKYKIQKSLRNLDYFFWHKNLYSH